MALQSCPECRKEYYDMADKCPNCSSPNNQKAYLMWKSLHDEMEAKKENKKRSIWDKMGFPTR